MLSLTTIRVDHSGQYVNAGREWGRAWRVVLGLPLPPARAKSPLAVVEHAEATRAAVQELLDEQAPPRWPF